MDDNNKNVLLKDYRPIIFVSNSSWYLVHYRKLLMKMLQEEGNYVMAMSPIDSSTIELSRILIHIPWRTHRSGDSNPASFLISFIRMLLLVRAIKPKVIHSYTLKANLISIIVTSIFGIPCMLSFAGMGKLSESKGFSKVIFICVIKLINFFALLQRTKKLCFKRVRNRSIFIFQNPIDLNCFNSIIRRSSGVEKTLIPGSGVPEKYFIGNESNGYKNLWSKKGLVYESKRLSSKIHFIYCGRLLYSKGIGSFIDLSSHLKDHEFLVFGGLDPSNSDCIEEGKIPNLQKTHENLSFLGNRKDPLIHIKKDYPVLLVPSKYGEGLPRAMAEALALGIPVICSKKATCGVFSEEHLYISEGDTIKDYENCFKRLINDYKNGSLNIKLECGYKFSRDALSELKIARQTMNCYNILKVSSNDSYLLNKDESQTNQWLAQ